MQLLTPADICRLIYQLLEYERFLKSGNSSPTPSERSSKATEEEEEWGRRRRLMDEAPSDSEEFDHESIDIREARALDKAMEDRIVARNSSTSSIASSSGVGMGPAWRSRYSERKRAASVASNVTSTGSVLSEDLIEEDEEKELLEVGGGFDSTSSRHRTSSGEHESSSISGESQGDGLPGTLRATPFMPHTARALGTSRLPPSTPSFRTSFQIPPPPSSATKSSLSLSSHPPLRGLKGKRRPAPLGIHSTVPSSPMAAAIATASVQPGTPRVRTESRKPSSPPAHILKTRKLPLPLTTTKQQNSYSALSTPSQTLFVFPPDLEPSTRTPSTMTLTSNTNTFPFPTMSTPRISTFRSHGRTKSFIGLGIPPTPTTACSRVDARGWIGME